MRSACINGKKVLAFLKKQKEEIKAEKKQSRKKNPHSYNPADYSPLLNLIIEIERFIKSL
mgnify:CR=1 FL=1